MKLLFSVNLISAIQDPEFRDYEALRIEPEGHYYLYRYLAEEGIIIRATVPSGATPPVFRKLKDDAIVPLGGWVAV